MKTQMRDEVEKRERRTGGHAVGWLWLTFKWLMVFCQKTKVFSPDSSGENTFVFEREQRTELLIWGSNRNISNSAFTFPVGVYLLLNCSVTMSLTILMLTLMMTMAKTSITFDFKRWNLRILREPLLTGTLSRSHSFNKRSFPTFISFLILAFLVVGNKSDHCL